MQEFAKHADGIEPLEVAGSHQRREIIELADWAYDADQKADLVIRRAVDMADGDGTDQQIAAAMRMASTHDIACRHRRSELARRLSRAGYKPGDKVACGQTVVLVARDLMPVTILGRVVPDFPAEALDSIDFDTEHSDRDELAERNRDYSQMIQL